VRQVCTLGHNPTGRLGAGWRAHGKALPEHMGTQEPWAVWGRNRRKSRLPGQGKSQATDSWTLAGPREDTKQETVESGGA
jgi:hypothetical protein